MPCKNERAGQSSLGRDTTTPGKWTIVYLAEKLTLLNRTKGESENRRGREGAHHTESEHNGGTDRAAIGITMPPTSKTGTLVSHLCIFAF